MRSKTFYKGIIQRAAHEATKGKRSEDIIAIIGILESIIVSYRAILARRNLVHDSAG